MEVLPSGSRAKSGSATYHFMMESRTSSSIDALYRLRDVQHSFADLQQPRTLQYEKRSTGKKAQDLRVEFDWTNLKATCRNSGEPEKTLEILPGTLDPLALIYALRLKELKPGATLEVPVTTGKGFSLVRGKVMEGGKIMVDGRSVDSVVVVPESASMKGLMKKQPPMKIWFSADSARIPLKLQTSHFFGNLDFELLSAATGASSPGGTRGQIKN